VAGPAGLAELVGLSGGSGREWRQAYNRPVHDVIFRDRRDAGRVLAQAVVEVRLPDLKDATVLGLVRGGVPVAYEVAVACGLPLDVMIVRKIGAPGNREFAMGAVASGGALVLNPDVVRGFQVSEDKLRHLIEEQQ